MKAEPAGGLRGFLRSRVGRIVLLLLSIGVVFATFTYVDDGAVLAIPVFLLVGLLLPIWAGLKRPRYLALSGLVVLLVIAPLANAVITQEIRTPGGPTSAGASFPSAAGPVALALNSTTGIAYAADFAANDVLVFNATSDTVLAHIAVGALPVALATSPSGHQLFVLDFGANAVSVVNLTSDRILTTVTVGRSPDAIAVDAGAGAAFVTNLGSGNVSVISTTTDHLVATVAVGLQPDAVAVDPAKGEVYVANRGSDTVTAIYTSNDSVAATVPVGTAPSDLAVNPNGSTVLASDAGSDAVSVLATVTNTVSATLSVGLEPVSVAADGSVPQAYVSNYNSSTVSVLSLTTDRVVRTVHVEAQPDALAVDDAAGELYVAEVANGTVSAVSTSSGTVLANTSVGSEPTALALDPAAGLAVVAAYGAQAIVLLSTSGHTVAHAIPDGLNGGLLQNVTVTPYTGDAGTTFLFTMSVYPWYVPSGNGEVLAVNLYLSTCPGATTANDSSCGSYSFIPRAHPFAGPLTSETNVSFAVTGLGNGIWTWTLTLVLSGVEVVPVVTTTANVTYLFLPFNAVTAGTEGPVVGSYGATYGEILPEIYITALVYLGIPFYFILVLYLWFKSREARRKEAIRRAAKAMGVPKAGPGPASGPGSGPPPPGPGPARPAEGAGASNELACPSCGAVIYPHEAKCWKCGVALGPGGDGPLPSKP